MKRMRWLLTVVVAGLLALAGCTTPGGNVAATVNGVPISVAQLDTTVSAVASDTAPRDELNAAVLTMAVRGQMARVIAAEQGIEINGQGRIAAIAANTQISGYAKFLDDPQARVFAEDAADLSLVLTKVGAEQFLARAKQIPVQLNPRYGSWSIDQLSVVSSGGQLSQPWVDPNAPA